jgi:CHAD domain-containing protein
LLRRLAFQASRTARLASADAVHDLRVSIRRLEQCLRLIGQFLPAERVKKVRRKMKAVMDRASQVRDRDIALAFLREDTALSDSPLVATLLRRREQAARNLVRSLQRWSRRDFHRKWRARLGL